MEVPTGWRRLRRLLAFVLSENTEQARYFHSLPPRFEPSVHFRSESIDYLFANPTGQ